MSVDFKSMSVKDLQSMAKENGIKGISGMKKQELIVLEPYIH